MPGPGDTICGDLRLHEALPAAWGCAAWQPAFTGRSDAATSPLWVTVIDEAFVPTSIDLSRFMAGANALAALRHPTLVRLALVDREATFCVVGHEALPHARTLADVLAQSRVPSPLRLGLEIARALAYLHSRGIVHGALTPATVLIDADAVALFQHGLATLCVPDVYGPRAQRSGSEAVAPELLRGDPVGPDSDVFAWGAIMAALATGRQGTVAVDTLRAKRAPIEMHAEIVALVRAALELEPEDRPPDGVRLLQLFSEALGRVATDDEQLASPWLAGSSGDEPKGLVALAQHYVDELAVDDRRGTPTPILEPEPTPSPARDRRSRDTPLPAPAGWLRPSEPVTPVADPRAKRPRWPVAHDLGDGVRKRTFAEKGAPTEAMEGDTPRDPLLYDVPIGGSEPVAAAPREPEPPTPPSTRVVAAPEPSPPEPEPEPVSAPLDESGDDQPTQPAGEATQPTSQRAARVANEYRPPRMPGPHGPPATIFAGLLALVVGAVAITATIRGVQARGRFSSLWDPIAPHGEPAEPVEVAPAPVTSACPEGMVRLPGSSGDPLTRVCIEIAEYPGWMQEPRRDVGFVEAQRLCAARERRLCSAAEWRRACAGTEGRRLPYGDARELGRCRTAAEGRRAPDPSGSGVGCATPEGVHDLVGNVAEWVAEGSVVGGGVASRNPTCETESTKNAGSAMGLRCCVEVP